MLRAGRNMAIELKAWRAAMGLTPQGAADKLGVAFDVYQRWEDGLPVGCPSMIEAAIGMPTAPVRFRQ